MKWKKLDHLGKSLRVGIVSHSCHDCLHFQKRIQKMDKRMEGGKAFIRKYMKRGMGKEMVET